ncbi:PPC domain-containing protein [Neorhodopirellula lusitana]|uniref:PPC domain-containing protein n=1 Tax=Neorhodopirellula lusitana TaxID=445327 RepID=UPI0038517888
MSYRTKFRKRPHLYQQLEARIALAADAFEPNDSMVGSIDIGAGPGQNLNELTIDNSNEDWFQFELLGPDAIDVDLFFQHVLGDLSLEVLDSNGSTVGLSQSTNDNENVSLPGVAAGVYHVRVFGGAP